MTRLVKSCEHMLTIWNPGRCSHLPFAWCHFSGSLCEVLRSKKWRNCSKDWTRWSTLEPKGRVVSVFLWFPFIFTFFFKSQIGEPHVDIRLVYELWRTSEGWVFSNACRVVAFGRTGNHQLWSLSPPKMSGQFGPGQGKRGFNFWLDQNSIILCNYTLRTIKDVAQLKLSRRETTLLTKQLKELKASKQSDAWHVEIWCNLNPVGPTRTIPCEGWETRCCWAIEQLVVRVI